jgi:RimJ/RimL family protein N-acetyltransferase
MKHITNYRKIFMLGKVIGSVKLVEGEGLPQLEYELDEEHWNKGIMTNFLKGYLEHIKGKHPKILAVVKKSNIASQRVLKKCGFLLLTELRDYFTFVNDLQASEEKKKIMRELLNAGFVEKIKNNLKK